VWVECERCSEKELDECEHLESGSLGAWVSLEFGLPSEAEIETLRKLVSTDPSLIELSHIQ
jgi:hypothetical protein